MTLLPLAISIRRRCRRRHRGLLCLLLPAVVLVEPLELHFLQLTLQRRYFLAQYATGLLGSPRPALERVHIDAVTRPLAHFVAQQLRQRFLVIRVFEPLLQRSGLEACLASFGLLVAWFISWLFSDISNKDQFTLIF